MHYYALADDFKQHDSSSSTDCMSFKQGWAGETLLHVQLQVTLILWQNGSGAFGWLSYCPGWPQAASNDGHGALRIVLKSLERSPKTAAAGEWSVGAEVELNLVFSSPNGPCSICTSPEAESHVNSSRPTDGSDIQATSLFPTKKVCRHSSPTPSLFPCGPVLCNSIVRRR